MPFMPWNDTLPTPVTAMQSMFAGLVTLAEIYLSSRSGLNASSHTSMPLTVVPFIITTFVALMPISTPIVIIFLLLDFKSVGFFVIVRFLIVRFGC